MWLGLSITLCFHCAEIPYLVTDTCSGDCDWTLDSSYIVSKYKMYFLGKSSKATARNWGCPSLCVFTVRKCRIFSQIHVLVFVTEHETPVTLQIYIWFIFCEKVVRQQHATGVASHFVYSLFGNAISRHRYMFWCLCLKMKLQFHCKYIKDVFFVKNL
jgi:hypothetical protein